MTAMSLAFTVGLAPATFAGNGHSQAQTKTHAEAKPSPVRVATKLKAPGKGAKKQCNGKTTTQCCEGISYCGCFYFPGSDATHPTSCKSSPPSGS